MRSASPGVVAQAVVDGLEVVEVEEEHGHRVAALGAPERVLHPLAEQGAVAEPGERVVRGRVAQALLARAQPALGGHALGHVEQQRLHGRRAVHHDGHRRGLDVALAPSRARMA
jgi:hypothetical protein